MVEMCRIVGYRDQLVTLLLLLAENVLNIILVHFQDGYAPSNCVSFNACNVSCLYFVDHLSSYRSSTYDSSRATNVLTYGTESDSCEDQSALCTKLMPTLERLELLSEVRCPYFPFETSISCVLQMYNNLLQQLGLGVLYMLCSLDCMRTIYETLQ